MIDDRRTPNPSRAGFTLIELLVVVAIMSLLATLAGVSLRGTMDRYHLTQAQAAIELSDARARRVARTNETPVVMRLDRGKNQMTFLDFSYSIPSAVRIASVRSDRRSEPGRQVAIQYGRDGSSPSYACELVRGSLTRWVVVIGSSGQIIQVDNRGAADELLRP